MGASAHPTGQPQRTKLRMSEAHHGHRGRNQNGTVPRRMSTLEYPASVLAAGASIPCIYSFNSNKSHLFIPFRKDTLFGSLLSGVFCCFSSTCPFLGCVCLTWPFHWVMFVMCPHAGTGEPLCGSLDLQFPGGSAPECPSGPLKGHLTCNNECLGDLSARAVAAPCVPPDSHLSLGLIHFCTWFYFFSLLWGFLVWVWFRFRFPT